MVERPSPHRLPRRTADSTVVTPAAADAFVLRRGDGEVGYLPSANLPTGGASLAVPLLAVAAVSGLRALMFSGAGVRHADPSSASYSFAGVSQGAAVLGDTVQALQIGPMSESTWNWTPGAPLYVGADGALVETQPSLGVMHQVAVAITPTAIFVQRTQPIIRQ